MKIAPKSTEAFLSKPGAEMRAILLYGPDSGLVRERAQRLIRHYLGQNFDPFALTELTESQLTADPAKLSDELNAISMMAPRRVLQLRDAGDKCTKIIEGAQESFNSDCTLIVCADELTPRSSLRAWFEKQSAVAAVACYHDEVRDVAEVVRSHFEKERIQTSREVIDYLCSQLGNDRYVTRQELEKISVFASEKGTLSIEEARALVDYNRETSFDELVNAVADKNLQTLEKTLTLILRENAQPVAYLRALQRYFNKLYAIRAQMQKGVSAAVVVESLRPPVFFRQAPILTRHAATWQPAQIIRALQLLVSAELACKSTDVPANPASHRRLLQITQIR